MKKLFYIGIVSLITLSTTTEAAKFSKKNKETMRRLNAFTEAVGIPVDLRSQVIEKIIKDSEVDCRRLEWGNVANHMRGVFARVAPTREPVPPPAALAEDAAMSAPLRASLRIAAENTRREVKEARRVRAEEEAKSETEARRLGTAARRMQEGVREHLAYNRTKERWAAEELERQQIIMAATGVFSTDRDDIRLGSLRTAARQILDSLESYMDLIGVPSCRRAQKYMREGGVIEPDVMPRHIEVYREVLERVVPADRPWVRPKDLVMEMDEPIIRRTLEDVDKILAKNSRVSRGVRHTAHIDPETNLADALPRG